MTGSRRYVVDWGHVAFVLFLATGIIWYLVTTRAVSTSLNNLLLVQPLSIAALLLCLLILPQCIRRAETGTSEQPGAEADDPLAPALPSSGKELARVAALGLALALMVALLEPLGFDIAIWLFAVAAMVLCGERRPLGLAIYPAAVTLVSVYGFKALMSYPMETTIL